MANKTRKIPESADDDEVVKVTLTLTVGTLRGLDEVVAEGPDVAGWSGAVRKLVRERRKPRAAKS